VRLWTPHPSYLDTKGLLALWREGLLAQKVLQGLTVGYRHHPALNPFRDHPLPLRAIATYLRWVKTESVRRGYCFNAEKIDSSVTDVPIPVSRQTVAAERTHLLTKLAARDSKRYEALIDVETLMLHESFQLID
jgi:hypothetical protein